MKKLFAVSSIVSTFYIVLQKQVEMSKFAVDVRVSLSTLFDQRAIIMSYTLQPKHKQRIFEFTIKNTRKNMAVALFIYGENTDNLCLF